VICQPECVGLPARVRCAVLGRKKQRGETEALMHCGGWHLLLLARCQRRLSALPCFDGWEVAKVSRAIRVVESETYSLNWRSYGKQQQP